MRSFFSKRTARGRDLYGHSDDHTPLHLETALDEAADWFARLRAESVSEAERRAFQVWHDTDVRHAAAYRRVAELWDAPQFASALASHAGQPAEAHALHRAPPPRTRWLQQAMAVAAALLIAVGLTETNGLTDLSVRLRADYQTATGVQEQVTLADGSALALNTGSAVAIDFQPDRRRVQLLKGETYFDVVADANHPFEIEADPAGVRVIGTAFTLRRSGADTLLTVRRGSVSVWSQADPEQTLRLGGNEQLRISPSGLSKPESLDPNLAFAWLENRFVFRDQALGDVLAELDRYHPGLILIRDKRLETIKVSGNYRLDDPAAIVAALAEVTSAELLRVSDYLLILN